MKDSGKPEFFINRYFFYFCRLKCNQHTNVKNTMDNDLFESISQRGSVEEIAENRRIIEIADGLRRSCQIYEAELRSRQENVSRFEIEQRAASSVEIDTYMAAIGFIKKDAQGRFENQNYEVWDLLPRNVLKDAEGDIYIIDVEINRKN